VTDALCVHCRKRPVEPRWRPFCSERCKLIDLGAWASEAYRVPVQEEKTDLLDEPPKAG